MLRVISGIYGGRKLKQPDLNITRCTKDIVKESVFSMIQFKIKNSIFLDLFSGSGSIAIEAVSRGSMKAIAIEKNEDAFEILNENVNKLKINNVEKIKTDAFFYLKNAKGKVFDFIYLDPPFGSNLCNQALNLISENNLLSNKGYIIVETYEPKLIKAPKNYLILKNRKYGKSNILLISKNI